MIWDEDKDAPGRWFYALALTSRMSLKCGLDVEVVRKVKYDAMTGPGIKTWSKVDWAVQKLWIWYNWF